MTTCYTRTVLLTLATTSSVLLFAGSANADRRNAAPIVYGEQTGSSANQSYQAQPTPARPIAPQNSVDDAKGRRLEFRYPDQPEVYYGNGGARAADAKDAPLAFSSSEAAIGSQAARQYAALPTQSFTPPVTPSDPAISAGGFDARAAAARVANERALSAPEPVRVTAKAPTSASPVGKPLTLSRVSANKEAPISEESGRAGIYEDGYDGRPTANGEIFDNAAMTAAHPSLPLPSLVQVINQSNGREIVVRVNDRGPFAGGKIMDLSERAASMLGFSQGQTVNVRVRYLGPAPIMQVPQSAASQIVQEEAIEPFVPAPVQVALQGEPNLGVADPYEVMTPSPTSVANARIFIQAGSFADIGNAQRLNAALGRRLPVEIQEARVNNADYFRVMIGPFDTRHEAETYRVHLSQSGITNGFIVEQ